MILKSTLQSNYSCVTPIADITGLKLTIPEDGYFLIVGSLSVLGTGTAVQVSAKIGVNGTYITASGGRAYHDASNIGYNIVISIPINTILYLKKGDVVTVGTNEAAGTCVILATDANYATYIEAINLTKLARGGM